MNPQAPGWRSDVTAIMRAFLAHAGRGAAVGTLLLMLAAALAEMLTLALLAPLLAMLTDGAGGRLRRIVEQGFAAIDLRDPSLRIAGLMLVLAAAIMLRATILAARDLRLGSLQRHFVDHLRSDLIGRVAGAGWQAFLDLRHARVAQALGTDIPRVAQCLHLLLATALASVMLGAQWLVVLALTPMLAGLVVVVGIAGLVLALPVIRRAKDMGFIAKRGQLRLLDTTGQLLGGLKLALAHDLGRSFVAEFDATQRDMSHHQHAFDRRRVHTQAGNSIGFAVALALIVLGGQWLRIPGPSLVAALAILARMAGPFVGLVQNVRDIAEALPFYRGLRELEADLPNDPTPRDRMHATAVAGPIRFDRAGFTHRGGTHPTLAPIDLEIAPGEIVGITGASGSGKTSFIDLVCGLLAPTTGQVSIGGIALSPDRLPAWRERLAYVVQDAFLFNDTVRRNLAWGHPALADTDLWAALALADADAIVRALPEGLDAGIAERGASLSGGERQRLALARAILRRPRLLILDEATNAIGLDAERRILTRLLPALDGATVLIVTHRPETLRFCTRLLSFGDGGLVGDERR